MLVPGPIQQRMYFASCPVHVNDIAQETFNELHGPAKGMTEPLFSHPILNKPGHIRECPYKGCIERADRAMYFVWLFEDGHGVN